MNILEPYKAHGLIFREENGKILINFCGGLKHSIQKKGKAKARQVVRKKINMM